jgi:Mn-dependent DtxR family transcriptional regulator
VSEPSPIVAAPRSILLRRVLGCLRDHRHDDTAERIAQRLGLVSPEVVEAALHALAQDRLVIGAGGHWQLTRNGWETARALDPSAVGR